MKKLIFSLFILSFLTQNLNAQSPQDEDALMLERLQNAYYTYLSNEGYIVKLEEDGEVSFKKEGKTYYITPYDEYTFEVSRWLELDEDVKCSEVFQMVNDFHFVRANERALVFDPCSTIQIQSFSMLNEKNDWKGIFDSSTTWLNNAVEDFWELYDENF